jgi:hypothetical protein
VRTRIRLTTVRSVRDRDRRGGVAAVLRLGACSAKGLAPGSDEHKQCVGQLLGGGSKPAPTFTPQQEDVLAACKAKGLEPDSDAFKKCVGQETGTGLGKPNVPANSPKVQAAFDACKNP